MDEALRQSLQRRGFPQDEVGLREALEAGVPGWVLYRLPPAAAKRWKCRYRVMIDAGYYDGMTAAEAYGRALLALPQPAAEIECST